MATKNTNLEKHFADVHLTNEVVKGVVMEILIPKSTLDIPSISLLPTASQYKKITQENHFSIQSNSSQFLVQGDTPDYIIKATECDSTSCSEVLLRTGCERRIDLQSSSIEFIKLKEESQTPQEHQIRFYITANKALFNNSSIDGKTKSQNSKNIKVKLNDSIEIEFDFIFKRSYRDKNQYVTTYDAVGLVKSKEPLKPIVSDLYKEVNDLLLLVSFATGIRTSCFCYKEITPEMERTYYNVLSSQSPKLDEEDGSFPMEVINNTDLELFLNTSYRQLKSQDQNLHLKYAFASLVPIDNPTLNNKFMSYISSLEGIVLQCSKENNSANLFDSAKWGRLEKKLRKLMKSNLDELEITELERQGMCKKLVELNRLSASDSYENFCTNCGIQTYGLWPMYDSQGGGFSLSKIRNRIAHGDHFSSEVNYYIAIAMYNLEYLLKRSVLALLKWPIEDSKVRIQSAQSDYAIKEYQSHMNTLKTLIK